MTGERAWTPRARRAAGLAGLLALALALRIAPLRGAALWTDELFSLAMATGHSLEQPAAAARPELGDYVEPPGPVAAARLAGYLRHDAPPASPARVIRAVLRSDTNPPLYDLLLWGWTRLLGTGDVALRSFSLLAALAVLPALGRLARRLGGRRAVAPALLLYALSPAAVYFATEGRMYALVLLLATATAAATVALRRRGAGARAWSAWVLLAAAGLLTHYFFVFSLAAAVAWLAIQPRRVSRRRLGAALAAVAVLVLPWYRLVPASLALWRVTGDWQRGLPEPALAALSPAHLVGSLLSGGRLWEGGGAGERALGLLLGVLVVALLIRGPRRAAWFCGLWIAGATLGLLAFDLWRETHCVLIPRYALPALPAVLLLAAAAASRMPRALAAAVVLAFAALWLPELSTIQQATERKRQPYGEIARWLDARLRGDDLVVLQSIPDGVAGLARQLPGGTPVLTWVEQLGVRAAPRDLRRWIPGRRRVAFVRLHTIGAPEPAREWLRAHLALLERGELGGAVVELYAGPGGAASAGRGAPRPQGRREQP